ncbi:M20-dimer domain-containing protein [Aphelenchoides fujianensis]|nr:M20-dimer domain-containing protein [Aphelenchoides fujianensis]
MADRLLKTEKIADFLVELMKIDSTTGKEGELAKAIKDYMKEKGWHVVLQPLPSNQHRMNVLITRVPFQETKPRIPLQLAPRHRAPEANKLDIHPDFLIVGEPTELKFGHAQKGALKATLPIRLDSKGKAAHSGYPEKGESAIHKLLDVLHEIRGQHWGEDKLLGETTLNVGLIEGGHAMNALADKANASLFFRVAESAAHVLDRVKEIADAKGIEVVDLGVNEPVSRRKPYESYTVAFNTDIPYYSRRSQLKGIFLFGGGSITNAHSADEFILIEELEKDGRRDEIG